MKTFEIPPTILNYIRRPLTLMESLGSYPSKNLQRLNFGQHFMMFIFAIGLYE